MANATIAATAQTATINRNRLFFALLNEPAFPSSGSIGKSCWTCGLRLLPSDTDKAILAISAPLIFPFQSGSFFNFSLRRVFGNAKVKAGETHRADDLSPSAGRSEKPEDEPIPEHSSERIRKEELDAFSRNISLSAAIVTIRPRCRTERRASKPQSLHPSCISLRFSKAKNSRTPFRTTWK